MADEWYYARDANRIGPFSGQQLKNLADLGDILRTDTVWKKGVEKGVLATKVKYLFSFPASVDVAVVKITALSKSPVVEAILPVVEAKSSPPLGVPPPAVAVPVSPVAPAKKAAPKPVRRGRALAMKGADIVSQDGINAKYRKKCAVCGHKDQSVQTIVITNKTTNEGYFCPKCKKRREVTIQCNAG